MLDTYFKKYFWTFNLLVLFVAASLLARSVNAFIGNALRPSADRLAEGGTAPVVRPGGTERTETVPVEAFLSRNVFKAAREDLTPPPPEDEEKPVEDGPVDMASCDPSSLGANLLATLVAYDDPSASLAVFQDTAKSEIGEYRIGDKVATEGEIIAIEWRNVYVKRGGHCESFSLEDEAKRAPTRAAIAQAPPTPAGNDNELGAGVKKTSESEYEIPREEIDNVLSNLNQVATQARIVPSFQNGKANGFKLFSIRPNSLYSKIGIQNGDIIQKINGYEINSPDKALEIYSKLKDAQSITVDLVRRGKSQTLSYNIR